MRTIKYFFYLLAAVALTGLASCQPEENFKPGKPDNAQCVGVYFPKQDVTSEQQIFSPLDVKHDSIQVSRTDDEDSLVVTLKVSLSYTDSKGVTHDADSNFFKVSDVEFEAGQSDAWVYLDFDEAEEGVPYILHLSIVGEKISSNYSSNLKACDYKVMCVKYVDFVSPKDSTKPAKVTFYQDWWGEVHTGYIKYYEVGGVRHCITYGEETAATQAEEPNWSFNGGFWGTGKDVHFEFDWYVADMEECECGEAPHPHKVPAGYTAPEGSELLACPVLNPVFVNGGSVRYFIDQWLVSAFFNGYTKPFLHWMDANSVWDKCNYYDGNGGFYFFSAYYVNLAGSGWSNGAYDVVGIAEGFTRADYSLKLTAGITQPDSQGNNVVPVEFDLGADVDKVGYTISKGSLSGAQITKEAAAIAKDTISYSYANFVDAQGVSFSDSISVAETGIYTLVAVALDTAKKAKSSASVTFHYLASGETNPVIISVGANNSDAYVSKGYSPETSFEVTISGSGITGAIPMVFSEADAEAKGGIGAIMSDIMSEPNAYYGILGDKDYAEYYLSASQLADVNDKGYVDIYADGVTPGTKYYFVVWATNGYDYTVSGAAVTTKGDPLPIYRKFDWNSYKDEAAPANEAGLYGSYNLYGLTPGGSSLRSYLGKSVISDDELVENEGPDSDGLYDEYVKVSGLGGPALAEYKLNPSITFDYYDGCLYVASNVTRDSVFNLQCFDVAKQNEQTWCQYAGYFIPVDAGYWVYIGSYGYYSKYGLNFNGIDFVYKDESYAAYYDYLLVEESVDVSAPKTSKKAASASAGKLDFYNNMIVDYNIALAKKAHFNKIAASRKSHVASLEGIKGLKSTSAPVRVEASHNVSKVSHRTFKNNPVEATVKTRKVK